MSDQTSVSSSAFQSSRPSGRLRPLQRATDQLASVPLPVVAVMLVLGAALSDVHGVVARIYWERGPEEWPQWMGRLTLMQYNLLVPAALLALWARRRAFQGRVGAIGASLIVCVPATHLLLTAGAVLWGLILGRGDMEYPFAYVEFMIFPGYLGIVVASVAWMRDRSAVRLIGPMILVGLILSFFLDGAITLIYGALALIILRKPLVRKDTAERPAVVS